MDGPALGFWALGTAEGWALGGEVLEAAYGQTVRAVEGATVRPALSLACGFAKGLALGDVF
ncbi:MAG: hypothetical protein SGARI_004390, partial [Bacillariaceae sp.]